jgi:hypothetical protein
MRATRKRLNERNQRDPGNHLVHLAQEDFFACLFVQGIKAEGGLIHDCYLALPTAQAVVSVALIFAEFP